MSIVSAVGESWFPEKA